MVVPFIEILAIMAALVVPPPVGIVTMKIFPVNRVGSIPAGPSGGIPVTGPGYIGAWIGVIRGPTIFIAEKVIQDAI